MDFELKGFNLKLDFLQSPVSSYDRQDRALVYRNGWLSRLHMNRGSGRRVLPIQHGRPQRKVFDPDDLTEK